MYLRAKSKLSRPRRSKVRSLQTHRQTDRHTDRQTDRQTDTQTDTQTDRQTDATKSITKSHSRVVTKHCQVANVLYINYSLDHGAIIIAT